MEQNKTFFFYFCSLLFGINKLKKKNCDFFFSSETKKFYLMFIFKTHTTFLITKTTNISRKTKSPESTWAKYKIPLSRINGYYWHWHFCVWKVKNCWKWNIMTFVFVLIQQHRLVLVHMFVCCVCICTVCLFIHTDVKVDTHAGLY